jgi:hypothetical protein
MRQIDFLSPQLQLSAVQAQREYVDDYLSMVENLDIRVTLRSRSRQRNKEMPAEMNYRDTCYDCSENADPLDVVNAVLLVVVL